MKAVIGGRIDGVHREMKTGKWTDRLQTERRRNNGYTQKKEKATDAGGKKEEE